MTRITRWEPFRESRRMHDMLDRLMDRSLLDPSWTGMLETGVPLDLLQTDDEVIVKASIPGLTAEDIEISITGEMLTIRGEVKQDEEREGAHYHIRERRLESFSRSIALPTLVNAEKSKAEFENGILTLTLPKVEEVKPKTITVKAK
ncbi:MAG: Hsp20/alpha crystallin family protein [Anaerolineales bacterium]|nr:MAG: Hsp20/alpha crystallin family protein [Anaerolineales bacterium]